jgi:predicted phosphoribosyltransferase
MRGRTIHDNPECFFLAIELQRMDEEGSDLVHLPFENRREAGSLLAGKLLDQVIPRDAVVLALARGGVPVGFEIAQRLGLPLDIVVVRKLGVPWQKELAMGAITSAALVVDGGMVRELGIGAEEFGPVYLAEAAELERREEMYRAGRPRINIRDRPVLLVDDGIATGNTLLAAIRHARKLGALSVGVAVPIGSQQGFASICRETGDAVCVCLAFPEPFTAVGQWYREFMQVSDEEVQFLLGATC